MRGSLAVPSSSSTACIALSETLQYARQVGHAGPPGRKATEAQAKYIMVDMFAKSIQGMKPEDAVAWATAELKRIYEA